MCFPPVLIDSEQTGLSTSAALPSISLSNVFTRTLYLIRTSLVVRYLLFICASAIVLITHSQFSFSWLGHLRIRGWFPSFYSGFAISTGRKDIIHTTSYTLFAGIKRLDAHTRAPPEIKSDVDLQCA